MSGNKCAYLECGKSSRKFPGLKTFTFPIRDELRCEKWITNSGNVTLLDLSEDKLKRRIICEDHFTKESFINHVRRNKLVHNAVPIDVAATKSIPSSSINCMTEPEIKTEQLISPSPSPELVVRKLNELQVQQFNNNKHSEISRLKHKKRVKYTPFNVANEIKKFKFASESSRILVYMQIFHTKRKPWTKKEKDFSLSIYFKSPSMYRFLRSIGIVLPNLPTIKSWITKSKCKTKLDSSLLYHY